MFTNGGRLELKKYFWIFVTWKWMRGVATLKTIAESPADMVLSQTEAEENVVITRREVGDVPRTLGCFVAADGSWNFAVGRWKTLARSFAQKIKLERFPRTCGSKLYPSFWLAKLR